MEKNYDLSTFKRALNGMVSKNDSTYASRWGDGYRSQTKTYTLKEIEKILQSGSLEEQQRLSRYFFAQDGFYKRLIIHYATLLKYAGLLIPNPSFGKSLSTSHISKRYHNADDFVDRLKIPVMLTEFATRALTEGCYYGVIQSASKEGIVLLDLPTNWCRSRFKDTQGNDIIEFNIGYFNSITSEEERESALSAYPRLIASAYRKWKKQGGSRWIYIPADMGVCFPMIDGRPIFLSVIPETIKYDEAIDLGLQKEAEEIKKIIVQKMPHLNDGRLVFEPDEAEEMHIGTVGMLKNNKNVSVLTTYADVEAITSKTVGESASYNVEKMLQNVYSKAGTSSEIFSSTGSSTLETSIENDVALMMVLANKFAIFITNLVNRLYANSNISFKYTIFPISYYNENKYLDGSFKLASSGYSLLLPAIAQGFTARDLVNVKDLENDVLSLTDKLIPLQTAFTQSGAADKGGAPKKEALDKAPKTIENEKSLDNQAGGSN